MDWTFTLSCWVSRLPDERQVLQRCCTEEGLWEGFFKASCSVCSSPCTHLPWQGRGVSHSLISDKPKEDKLAAFPFLFFFFYLVAIAAGRVGWGQDISGLQRMWAERRRCLRLSWAAAWTPSAFRAFPPPHRFGFNCLFFFLSLVEFNT